MNAIAVPLAVCLFSACTLRAQPEPRPDPEREARARVVEELRKQGVALDLDQQTAIVRAVVNRPADPIEYLLIHPRGKGHEALFVTEVQPSVLNSALLMLGFQEGKNADLVEKQPLPSEAELEKGVSPYDIVHPTGNELWITVRWREADKPVEVCAGELIVDLTTEKPAVGESWIFLGGRMAPLYRNEAAVFVADYEGNLVSICYLRPNNHLATMRHERALDDQNWWVADRCPPPGTEVEVVFHAREPDLAKARRERDAAAKTPDDAKDAGKGR
jgi:hypothetical protein